MNKAASAKLLVELRLPSSFAPQTQEPPFFPFPLSFDVFDPRPFGERGTWGFSSIGPVGVSRVINLPFLVFFLFLPQPR